MEIWKDIEGYENEYQISNLGNVRSLTKKVCSKNGSFAIKKGHIKKQTKRKKGYLCVTLSSKGKAKVIEVQRLVAKAFIPNPNNYPCVNHLDENKENNRVENLEWCSYEQNNAYGECRRKAAEARINGKMSKKVYKFDLDNNYLCEYPSLAEVKRLFGYDSSKISLCARGKRKTAYGYIWSYRKEIGYDGEIMGNSDYVRKENF